MAIIDPFDSAQGQIIDPFAFETENFPSQPRERGNSIINGVQDVARFFLPIATAGINAIGTGIGQAAAGGNFTDGLTEGAQKEDILGFDLGMETDAGKWVEGKMSDAFKFLHDTFGETAVDAFKNDTERSFLKRVPQLAPLAALYEVAGEEGKRAIEGAASGMGAAAPDIMLALLGGKGAKTVAKKMEDGQFVDAAELARQYADEPLIPEGEKAPTSPNEPFAYKKPGLELAPEETFTPETRPQTGAELPQYEGGIDFDFGGLDTVKQDNIPLQQTPDSPQIDLPLIPRGKETDLRFKGNQHLRPNDAEAPVAPDFSVDPRQQQLDFEQVSPNAKALKDLSREVKEFKADSEGMPLGLKGAFKGQRGSVGFIGKETPIEQLATKLNREEWGAKFAEKNPQFKDRPDVIDRVYDTLNQGRGNGKPPVTNLAKAIEDNPLLKAVDKGLGVLSTRIGNISQPVLHRAMKFEQGLLQNTHNKIARADSFLTEINKKVPKQVRGIIDNALIDNDFTTVNHVLNRVGRPDLVEQLKDVRAVLAETGKELQDTNSLENLRSDYFPRIVKDLEGLKETMGTTHRAAIETRLNDAQQKAGRPLDEVEQSKIVNSYLRGTMKGQYRPGFTKGRKFDAVPDNLKQFYASPTQALHTYLRNAVQEIETAKFFGRDAIKNPDTNKIDVDKSIGGLVAKELREGKINGQQAAELSDMLQSRFGSGNKSSNLAVQTFRDAANIGLLGNVVSTITQAGDVGGAIYLNGLVPTLASIAQMAMGKQKLSMKDFGLVDHISEEFVNSRKSGKAVNAVYKATGFQALDRFGKNTILNGSIKQAERMLKTKNGMAEFSEQWAPRFGEEFPQLVKDLREGKVTPLTQTYAFSKLAKIQPITKLELPQKYLDMPNGRMIYMLKSFAIKQLDLVRNDSINEIKKGNVRKGLSNLMKYSLVLGMSGATTGYVKDWLTGRDVDPELSDIPLNVLKTFGYSDFVADKVTQGRVGEAVGDVVLPPYKMFDIIGREAVQEFDGNPFTNAKGKSLNYVPGVGRILYERLYGGAEEHNRQQFREMIKGED